MTDLTVRRAEPEDLHLALDVVAHMFVDLGTSEISDAWRSAAAQALMVRTAASAMFVVFDGEDRLVGLAAGVVDQRLPSPRRPDGRIGYVEWLATAQSQRRRGVARLAMATLMSWFKDQGVAVVDVHASSQAQPLYLEMGFQEPSASPLRWRE